jgi:glycosyltransferase involved in cell wall biosynthesis
MLSIVIPTYNRATLIDATLTSALAVLRADDELIVRDNRSTDDTPGVVRRRTLGDSRIRLLEASTNEGPVRNWLQAIDAARGDTTLLLFSDDLLLPEGLRELRERFEASAHQVAFGAALIGPEPSVALPEFVLASGSGTLPAQSYLHLMIRRLGSVPVSPAAYLFRTEALRQAVARTMLELGQDRDALATGAGIDLLIVAHAVMDAGECLYRAEPHVFFRQHENSMSTAREAVVQRLYRESRVMLVRRYQSASLATLTGITYAVAWRLRSIRRAMARFVR